jgi:ATP-dependent exoDNAse (exonuclease V) alpha subunit
MLTIEREIGEIATRLSAPSGHAPDKRRVEELIAENKLSAEQAEAARAATSGEKITIGEGAPGSGKTTLLKPVVQAWQEAGYRVIGCATAWKIAHALRDDLGIDARATDSWLATAGNGGQFLDEKTVVIVDEAGLLSSRQMHALLTEIERASRIGKTPPRVILTGDRNQLQSVGAGAGLRLLASALSVQRVDQIVRQREQWAREAVRDFGKGEADKALAAFAERGLVAEAQGAKATVKSLVGAWSEAKAARPNESALLIAKTNAQLRAISAEVRARLREEGTIVGDDLTLSAVSPSGQDVSVALAKGDRIRFLARAQFSDAEVINGTEATIETVRWTAADRIEIVARTKDARIRFSPDDIADDKGRAKIAHAYATTIHGAQGLTVDRAFCWLTPEMNRHDVYVAASRAREDTCFFIDAKAVDKRIVAELPLDKRTLATEASAEDRRDYLARQVSRSGLKQTTLDVLLAAREREEERLRRGFDRVADDAQPKPRRSRELSL